MCELTCEVLLELTSGNLLKSEALRAKQCFATYLLGDLGQVIAPVSVSPARKGQKNTTNYLMGLWQGLNESTVGPKQCLPWGATVHSSYLP